MITRKSRKKFGRGRVRRSNKYNVVEVRIIVVVIADNGRRKRLEKILVLILRIIFNILSLPVIATSILVIVLGHRIPNLRLVKLNLSNLFHLAILWVGASYIL